MNITQEFIAYHQRHEFKEVLKYVKEDCLAMIKLLLDNGLNPNKSSDRLSLGYYALKHDHFEMFNLLKHYGLNLDDPQLLTVACEIQLYPMVELLLEHTNPNKSCYYPYHGGMRQMIPLYMAIKRNNISIVTLLLSHGADRTLFDEMCDLYGHFLESKTYSELKAFLDHYDEIDIKEPEESIN
jgi:ankyrin repeat protein